MLLSMVVDEEEAGKKQRASRIQVVEMKEQHFKAADIMMIQV